MSKTPDKRITIALGAGLGVSILASGLFIAARFQDPCSSESTPTARAPDVDAIVSALVAAVESTPTVREQDVTEIDESQARAVVEDDGLAPGDVRRKHSTMASEGRVIPQSPNAGTTVDEEDGVTIAISDETRRTHPVAISGITGVDLSRARQEARHAKNQAAEEFARVREDPLVDENYSQGEGHLEKANVSSARGDPDAALEEYQKATRRYGAATEGAKELLRILESRAQEALGDAEEAERVAKRAFDEAEASVAENANYSKGNSLLAAGRTALNSSDYHNASQSFLAAKRYFDQARPALVIEAAQPVPEPAPTQTRPAAVASQKAPEQIAQEEQVKKAAEEQRRHANEQAAKVVAEAQTSRDRARARFEAQNSTPRANRPFLEAEKALQDARAAAERGDFSSAQDAAQKAQQLYDEAKPPEGLIRDGGSSIIR